MKKVNNSKNKILTHLLEKQVLVSGALTSGLEKWKNSKNTTKKEGVMLDTLLLERSMTHQELFGKFMESFRWVDQQMRYCIRDKNMKYNYQNDEKNFGKVLTEFKQYYPDHSVIEWLEDLGNFRGNSAHNYFKNLHLYSLELGENWKHVEHRSLQKAIRAAEHCMVELNNLRYKNQVECEHLFSRRTCKKCGYSK